MPAAPITTSSSCDFQTLLSYFRDGSLFLHISIIITLLFTMHANIRYNNTRAVASLLRKVPSLLNQLRQLKLVARPLRACCVAPRSGISGASLAARRAADVPFGIVIHGVRINNAKPVVCFPASATRRPLRRLIGALQPRALFDAHAVRSVRTTCEPHGAEAILSAAKRACTRPIQSAARSAHARGSISCDVATRRFVRSTPKNRLLFGRRAHPPPRPEGRKG